MYYVSSSSNNKLTLVKHIFCTELSAEIVAFSIKRGPYAEGALTTETIRKYNNNKSVSD